MKKSKAKAQPSAKKSAVKAGKNDVAVQLANGVDTEEQSIDKVRNILFGAQTKQYEQKFTRLEKLVQKEIKNLRDQTDKNFDSLEKYLKKELESISDQLNTEKDERGETVEDLSKMLKDINRNLDKKITKLNDKSIKSQRDLQEQILQQSKDLMVEIRTKYEEISAQIERSVSELDKGKTDRIDLANLLLEVSMRLKGEFEIPEVK